MQREHKYDIVVIGGSNGALEVVIKILESLPKKINYAIVIILHQSRQTESLLKKILQQHTAITVHEPLDKEPVEKGSIYVATPNYHLMIEQDKTFAYSYSELVNYSRPSIDVLFETAANVYRSALVVILLTGANADGSAGISTAKKLNAFTIAQEPATAISPYMPAAAINTGYIDKILSPEDIIKTLITINKHPS